VGEVEALTLFPGVEALIYLLGETVETVVGIGWML
jgi:hypothetical protein